MNYFYQKFDVPNLSDIQKETLDYFEKNSHLILDETEYWVHIPLDEFPILKQFLESRAKIEISETSVNFLAEHHKSKIHIDGLKKDNGNVPEGMMIAHQHVLVIPIRNYENSVNYWYNNNDVSDEDERIHNYIRDQFPYNFYVSFVKDHIKLDPIESTTIDKPTFIQSNIYHGVHNNGPETRMVFLVRFRELEPYESANCVFDYQDLLNN